MTAEAEFASLVDRLVAASNEAKNLLRQVHEATKDLKTARREADEARHGLLEAVQQTVEARIRDEVTKQMEELGKELSEARDMLTSRMERAFQGLHNLYVYGNEEGTGTNLVHLMRQHSLGNVFAAAHGMPLQDPEPRGEPRTVDMGGFAPATPRKDESNDLTPGT